MPVQKLTQLVVDRLRPPASGRIELFDAALPGFALRMSETGHRSWVLFYWIGGRQRRLTIPFKTHSKLEDARAAARQALQLVERGIDPAEEKKAARNAPAPLPDAFAAIAAEFLEKYARPNTKLSSFKETKRILERDVIPAWRDRSITSITRRDVRDLLDTIIDRGAVVQANRTLARLKTLLAWAVEKEVLTVSPVATMKKVAKEIARDRALSDDEIRWFWKATGELGWPFGPLFQLLLVTAQRRDEVGTMEWPEVEIEKRLWTIPREKAKNDRAHLVQLSDLAVEILGALPRVSDRIVFTTTGERPVSGFSKAKERLDRLMVEERRRERGLPVNDAEYREALGLKPADELPVEVPAWILHDLRRTAATGMAGLNIPPQVVDKILNHVSGTIRGVAAVYNRFGYLEERRSALEAWGRRLSGLTTPSEQTNVVELARA